jgi:protein-tyrosine sulfotransferase
MASQTREKGTSMRDVAHGERPVMDRSGLVHVCGFPSAGTDLLSNFLSAHPEICVRGEFPMLPKLARRFGAAVPRERVHEVVAALRAGDVYKNFENRHPVLPPNDKRTLVPLAEVYGAMLTNRHVRWRGNKTPQNTENMDRLLYLFPDTRFIFISRDIRDTCLSWREKWAKDIYLCAARWNARMMRGLDVGATLPAGRLLMLHFEDLIREPAETGRKVCDFLGLEYNENFINYHLHVKSRPDGKKNFGTPMKPQNREKWRASLSPREIRRIEEIAMPTMQRLGYRAEFATAARPITRIELARGLAMDATSALLVGNRYWKRNRLQDRLRRIAVWLRYRMPGI